MAEIPPQSPYGQIDAMMAHRAAIEQAKGVLMFVYCIDGDRAHQLLKSRSRATRVKIHLFARQLVDDVANLAPEERMNLPSACSNVLRSVHHRVMRPGGGP